MGGRTSADAAWGGPSGRGEVQIREVGASAASAVGGGGMAGEEESGDRGDYMLIDLELEELTSEYTPPFLRHVEGANRRHIPFSFSRQSSIQSRHCPQS